jgi:hypothetical protein
VGVVDGVTVGVTVGVFDEVLLGVGEFEAVILALTLLLGVLDGLIVIVTEGVIVGVLVGLTDILGVTGGTGLSTLKGIFSSPTG